MKQDQPKILLIEPPFYRLFKPTYSLSVYPLGLGYLAGMIRRETRWNVMVYNADFSPQQERVKMIYLTGAGHDNYLKNLEELSGQVWREVKLTIAEYKPTVVGISAKSQNFASARIVAKLAKEINKQTVVIIGGPHTSMVGGSVLNYPEIDIGVKREGENTIIELLLAIEKQEKIDSIQGIVYRKDGHVVENPPRKYIDNLDSFPFPHENAPEVLKDYDKYPKSAFGTIFGVRGCPFDCFFCGSRNIWGRKVRFRSPENVVREIKSLQSKGVESIHFSDDLFGVNRHYIKDLCNALKIGCPGLRWSCLLHVNLVDEEIISLMKAAGCYLIELGIESGNNEILKKIRKKIDVEKSLSASKIIKKHGMILYVDLIIGFPQDTEDTVNDTIVMMKKIPSDRLSWSIFNPYPGTEAFEFCKQNGLIDSEYDVSLHHHYSPDTYFCMNITRERFSYLVSKVAKLANRKNWLSGIKRISSLQTFWEIRHRTIGDSIKIGVRILLNRFF